MKKSVPQRKNHKSMTGEELIRKGFGMKAEPSAMERFASIIKKPTK